jgi:N-methylhydantoinase B
VRADLSLNTHIERVHCKPWGLAGGMEAAGNGIRVRVDGKFLPDLPNGKMYRRIKKGDGYTHLAGGGGGYGPPQEREVARVAYDVKQGYVSVAAAREFYKVAVNEDGEVDHEETRRMRSAV